MPVDILDALDLLIIESIGMTVIALGSASAGDLTLSQWRAMVVVGRADGVRVGDVARAVGIWLPSASRMFQRLERRGIATTSRDSSDRRAVVVRLTAQGQDIRRAVIERRRELLTASLSSHVPHIPSRLGPGLAAIASALARYQ